MVMYLVVIDRVDHRNMVSTKYSSKYFSPFYLFYNCKAIDKKQFPNPQCTSISWPLKAGSFLENVCKSYFPYIPCESTAISNLRYSTACMS